MKFRTLLLGVSALLVAACAAYFSVLGLSKLFAGESLLVIIMAGSLELAKLVSAGFIYNYWEKLNKLLRGYLTAAVVILMLITSAGIYGFLTSAYKVTSDQLDVIDKQTEIIELKKGRYSEELANYNDERNQLNSSIGELSKGLANNVIQYRDTSGQIITTTSSATRKALTAQLEDFKTQRGNVTEKIDVLNDSITSLDLQVLDLTANNEVAAEIGPLRYISDITGKDMDTVVNWFALFIVLVFDPLAVTLIVAFNAAMKIDKGERDKKKSKNSYKVYGDTEGLYDEEEDDYWQSYLDDEEILIDEEVADIKSELNDLMNKKKPEEESGFSEEDVDELIKAVEESDGKFEERKVTDENDVVSEAVNDVVNDIEVTDVEVVTTNDEILKSEKDKEVFFNEIENPSEPNPVLKEAFKKYKTIKEIGTPTPDNPKWIDYENKGGWKQPYKESEFWHHPWFDWNKADRWINDKKAVKYWLDNKAGTMAQLQKYKDMYPNSDNTKIY